MIIDGNHGTENGTLVLYPNQTRNTPEHHQSKIREELHLHAITNTTTHPFDKNVRYRAWGAAMLTIHCLLHTPTVYPLSPATHPRCSRAWFRDPRQDPVRNPRQEPLSGQSRHASMLPCDTELYPGVRTKTRTKLPCFALLYFCSSSVP
ncbi:hypothetical protein VF21_09836 [Pseudogymnoascus sp. 05NY08]|nr:hypothetical protein VF21_09836 [Pseudogymnoascus sp. 05NY08]